MIILIEHYINYSFPFLFFAAVLMRCVDGSVERNVFHQVDKIDIYAFGMCCCGSEAREKFTWKTAKLARLWCGCGLNLINFRVQ